MESPDALEWCHTIGTHNKVLVSLLSLQREEPPRQAPETRLDCKNGTHTKKIK
jgi:hypothetical protein